jgi:hypothetical protein
MRSPGDDDQDGQKTHEDQDGHESPGATEGRDANESRDDTFDWAEDTTSTDSQDERARSPDGESPSGDTPPSRQE